MAGLSPTVPFFYIGAIRWVLFERTFRVLLCVGLFNGKWLNAKRTLVNIFLRVAYNYLFD